MNNNIIFLEEYKRLDKLCKDYFSSSKGVYTYIEQMKETEYQNRRYVSSWDDDYKQLKHIKWVRNQIAHEVGTADADFCTQNDIDYVIDFRNRILNLNDPFSVAKKAKQQEQIRKINLYKSGGSPSPYDILKPDQPYRQYQTNTNADSQSSDSLFERFINFLERLLG